MRTAWFASVLLGAWSSGAVASGTYASVNGLRMYYEERGSGRPLVLLHGGGSTAQTSFGALMPRLAAGHRVIAPEQQGHGHTADRDRPFSFEQMADDTDALLGQLGVRDADVIGFSAGGMVALQLALRHPERVRRLVLCSSFYAHTGLAPALRAGFEHASASDMPPALLEAYRAAAPKPDLPHFVGKSVALMTGFPDMPESTLRAMKVPTLVMAGDRDVIVPEHSVRMAQLIPGAQLAILPGSAHGTYLGAAEAAVPGSPLPEITLRLVEAFLAAPGAPAH
jgi:pimeloyl-ACP methyl ester carboxylesterase